MKVSSKVTLASESSNETSNEAFTGNEGSVEGPNEGSLVSEGSN